jgi:hypothetical protein
VLERYVTGVGIAGLVIGTVLTVIWFLRKGRERS